MKSYQTLAVIGGVLGILIVFGIFVTLGVLSSVVQSLGGQKPEQGQVQTQIGISIALYLVAIVIPFALKKTKIIGGIMLGIAIATLISSGWFGILGFGLLIASGIAALRHRSTIDTKSFDTKPSQ